MIAPCRFGLIFERVASSNFESSRYSIANFPANRSWSSKRLAFMLDGQRTVFSIVVGPENGNAKVGHGSGVIVALRAA
jgi:hypothetical protein